jgi:hypothetical protein
MDEHTASVMEQAKRKLAEQEQAVIDSKKFINQLCQFGGIAPIYKLDEAGPNALGIGAIQSDSFYGKSAFTAVREFLDMRRTSSLGAATYNEIIQALEAGGFDFSTLSPDKEIAMRAVAITLGKNSSIFHKLPNGNWGLLSWYPEAKEKKKQKASESAANGEKDAVTPPKEEDKGKAPKPEKAE